MTRAILAVAGLIVLAVAALGSVRLEIRRRGGAGRIIGKLPGWSLQWLTRPRPPFVEDSNVAIPDVYLPAVSAPDLGPYYVDCGNGMAPLDCPSWKPCSVRSPAGEAYVVPTAVAQIGLNDWTGFCLDGNPRRLEFSRSAARWMESEQGPDGAWRIASAFQEMGRDWPSAMTQGLAISLLCRMHGVDQRERSLECAVAAYGFMMRPVALGGTLTVFSDGGPSLEEYPGALHTRHVLNGAIFAVIGVRDLGVHLQDSGILTEWDRLAAALADHLDEYDTGHWSRYGLPANGLRIPANPTYHGLHIAQLRVMAALTGDARWTTWADRWNLDMEQWARGATRRQTA